MPLVVQILVACLLGGLVSLLIAGFILFGLSKKWLPYAISFSTGILLATAFLHLLPEALDAGLAPDRAFAVLLAGIIGFFVIEKAVLWRHLVVAPADAGRLSGKNNPLAESGLFGIVIGDACHNFTDGLLIAAAFLTDPALGWATTLAVIAHEVPQEAGDFAILLAAGWARRRAVLWNGLCSLASVAGGLVAYFALDYAESWTPYIVIVAAASFLYIAIANLLPRLRAEWQGMGWHGMLLGAGIALSFV
jgi:zinc and cadmium transporter